MKLYLLKFHVSFSSIGRLFKRPAYIFFVLFTASVFMQMILWGANFSLARYIVVSDTISPLVKTSFFISSTKDVFTNLGVLTNALLVFVSILQGIVIVTLAYVIKFNRRVDTRIVGSSLFATVLATVGLGCVACGTSLLVPIVAIFASSSAAVITKSLTTPVMILSIVVAIFSLYKVGLQAASVVAQEDSAETGDLTPPSTVN